MKSPRGEMICGGDYLELRKVKGKEFSTRIRGTGIVEIIACRQPKTPEPMRIILIEQYRDSVGRNMIELPAGACGDHDESETLEDACQRELMEEVGYKADRFIFLSSGASSAGVTDEIVSFFLALDLTKCGEGGGVDDENIIIHEVPCLTVNSWLTDQTHQGKMIDPRVYAGIYLRIAHLTGRPQDGKIQ